MCLSACVGRSVYVCRARFSWSVCHGSSVHSATHLPYDKEDESGTQHQGEHVAEGRKGERHGCARQPDSRMGREREKGLAPSLFLSNCIAPTFQWKLLFVSSQGFPLTQVGSVSPRTQF